MTLLILPKHELGHLKDRKKCPCSSVLYVSFSRSLNLGSSDEYLKLSQTTNFTSKLKEFADDNFKFEEKFSKGIENTEEKRKSCSL